MTDVMRALLAGVVDYAGLFPPAALSLADAVRLDRDYRTCPEAWMLGRFVCPAARLRELADLAEGPLPVSALLRGGPTAGDVLANLELDRADLATFVASGPGRTVDAVEVRLPDGGEGDDVLAALAALGVAGFVERQAGLATGADLPAFLARLAAVGLGYKIRTGGLEASAFPEFRELGRVIAQCAAAGVPLKATAGLHHAFPGFDSGVKAVRQGFVNVVAAGAFAGARSLNAEYLGALLADGPEMFSQDEGGLKWRRTRVTAAEIREARARGVLSFGSCSFDEPRDDLRALGWL